MLAEHKTDFFYCLCFDVKIQEAIFAKQKAFLKVIFAEGKCKRICCGAVNNVKYARRSSSSSETRMTWNDGNLNVNNKDESLSVYFKKNTKCHTCLGEICVLLLFWKKIRLKK